MDKSKKPDYNYFPEDYQNDIDDLSNSTASATDFTGLIPAVYQDIDEQESYDDIIELRPPIPPTMKNNK
ncbi:MAG: hypothetical protein PHV07_00730 [Oscillospiraceae bacterium]|nr:hypothetical protein [Oscillospiraceae bacterium]